MPAPHHSVFYRHMPFQPPNQQRQSTEGTEERASSPKNWRVGCWHGYLSAARCTCIWPSWCHCHSLSLASVKSRLVSPFLYWLTQVVSEKGPLNGCVCVCFQGNFHRYHTRVLPLALKCYLFVTAKILVWLKDRFRMNIRAFSCILGILKTHYSHIIGA